MCILKNVELLVLFLRTIHASRKGSFKSSTSKTSWKCLAAFFFYFMVFQVYTYTQYFISVVITLEWGELAIYYSYYDHHGQCVAHLYNTW